MATKHLIYTTGLNLYGSDLKGADSTSTSAITEDATYSGIYPADTGHPFVYVRAGATPDPTTDTLIGDVRQEYYGTVDAAVLFHTKRIHAWDFDNANLEDRVKALYNAQQMIDRFAYVGSKTDDDQSLEFPRTRTLDDGTVCLIGGSAGIPTSIEQAAYLIADALLGGRDPQADFEALNVKVETFGPVRTEFDTSRGAKNHIANMIPSPAAWALIMPFLAVSSAFTQKKG